MGFFQDRRDYARYRAEHEVDRPVDDSHSQRFPVRDELVPLVAILEGSHRYYNTYKELDVAGQIRLDLHTIEMNGFVITKKED